LIPLINPPFHSPFVSLVHFHLSPTVISSWHQASTMAGDKTDWVAMFQMHDEWEAKREAKRKAKEEAKKAAREARIDALAELDWSALSKESRKRERAHEEASEAAARKKRRREEATPAYMKPKPCCVAFQRDYSRHEHSLDREVSYSGYKYAFEDHVASHADTPLPAGYNTVRGDQLVFNCKTAGCPGKHPTPPPTPPVAVP
jgi:hypothetical protein